MSFLTHAMLAQVGQGRIEGGWEYIWAAYGLTWLSLALYGVSLWLRRRSGEPPKELS
ncbi:MAG: hypothetical protein HYZ28_07890 [Myxococcales bacterium]|nr:hypothetical protein [Myxococcales bacterium]